jgi:hypothetical protein
MEKKKNSSHKNINNIVLPDKQILTDLPFLPFLLARVVFLCSFNNFHPFFFVLPDYDKKGGPILTFSGISKSLYPIM